MKDGGPAFPYIEPYWQGRRNEPVEHAGMSLRDYFAAAAMQGWLATFGTDSRHPFATNKCNDIAVEAYAIADAMLEVRDK